jgi:hypothetical protein
MDVLAIIGANANQERLYFANRMVRGVADCLIEFSNYSGGMELWDLMELAG